MSERRADRPRVADGTPKGVKFAWLCLLGVALQCPACRAPVPGEMGRHIAMFDGEGEPVDLTDRWGGTLTSYDTWSNAEFGKHVETIVKGVRDHVTRTGSRKVLVFIHGGLNEQPETIRRALDLTGPILADDVYPIFVNWQSNLVSSYFAHLLFVRQGRDWGGWGVLVSPFYLLTDAARALFRFPVVAGHQIAEGLASIGLFELKDRSHARDATRELMREAAGAGAHEPEDKLRLDLPRAAQGFSGKLSEPHELGIGDVGTGLRYVVTLPFKPLSIFLVDAAGTGSWQVMRRRVELLFQKEAELEDFDGRNGEPRVKRPREGLLLLMSELAVLQDELDLEITVIGHSMGTIVLNRLLFYSQLAGRGSDALHLPDYRNIVYMAAACSLRDYEQSAFCYLQHDPRARLFHVVLHPDEELDESNAWDVSPRGSLLVWVDDFLAQPATLLDRTAGRYDNLMVALPNTPLAVRHQIHVRVLGRYDEKLPLKHGQFTDPGATKGRFLFWKRESWWPWWSGDEPVQAPKESIHPQAFAHGDR